MTKRSANPAQAFARRLFEAAAKVGVNVRMEFHPDGRVVATTTTAPMLPSSDNVSADLERWMRKQHADAT
jgi:hypothetical protein